MGRSPGLPPPRRGLSEPERIHAGEHHVFFDEARDRYVKITHGVRGDLPGFDLTVDTDFVVGRKSQRGLGVPFVRDATPCEYLERLALFSRILDDETIVEGVFGDPGQTAIVVSQKTIEGRSATAAEVAEHLASRDFLPVPGVAAGRQDSVTYFRSEGRVAVFDTHGENFIIKLDGGIAPIDALIIAADEALARYLSLPPAERREEVR